MRIWRKIFPNESSFINYLNNHKQDVGNFLYVIVMGPLEEAKIKERLLYELPIGKWCFIKNPVYGGDIEIFIFVNDVEQNIEDFYCVQKEIVTGNFFDKELFIKHLYIELSKENQESSALVILDIDDFKNVNGAIGYAGGDVVLHILTCRLVAILPEGSFATRLYGDKYVVFIKNTTLKKIDVWLKKLLRVISIPIVYGEHEFYVTASIGVYCLNHEVTKTNEALKRADIAMHWAKKRGRNCIVFYESVMSKYESEKLEKSNVLMKMYRNKDFYLVYQPILCLRSNRISGFEVLMRCKDTRSGKLCMQDVIAFMEEMGVIYEVGKWVMEQAFKQVAFWNRFRENRFFVSVNVSAVQIQNGRFIEDLQEIIRQTGIKSDEIFLEITETSMLSDLQFSAKLIQELKKLGINVSIDDFGTGYSSLNYLKSLKTEVLKIAHTFVRNIEENYTDLAIVRAIVSLGHHLGMKVIAEGVETEEQVRLLREIGCDYIQGFFISPPLTAEEVCHFNF